MAEKYEMIILIISEGAIEILHFLNQREVGYFKELRNLKNLRTGRYFSASTISTRLKELSDYGAIEKAISTVSGRNVVAYRINEAGKKTLELADRFEGELKRVLKK